MPESRMPESPPPGPGRLPTPAPTPGPETAEFWAATGEGRLLLRRCRTCATVIWYPRSICPECHGSDVEWFEARGTGRVYSYTVSRRGEGAYRDVGPYVLAYVELDEGPRLLTNVVGCAVDDVRIDLPVTVSFDDTGEGNALVRFRPLGQP